MRVTLILVGRPDRHYDASDEEWTMQQITARAEALISVSSTPDATAYQTLSTTAPKAIAR